MSFKTEFEILLLHICILSSAQVMDPIIQFVYTKGGDVYVAQRITFNDSTLVIDEINLGTVELSKSKLSRTETIYPSTILSFSLGANTKYKGKILKAENAHFIFLCNEKDTINVDWHHLSQIEIIGDSNIKIHNPNSTRYFFAPSGIPLDKGSGYYQNAYILSNSANFGVSNHFTLGGGVIIPLLFYITPKISWEISKNFYMGTGMIAATTIIPDFIVSGGIPYGIVTYGSTENNITLAGGYALLWEDGNYRGLNKPIFTLNGMLRLSNKIHLVSENWLIPYEGTEEYEITPAYQDSLGNWGSETYKERDFKENYLVLSAGLRIKTGKQSSFDFSPLYIKGSRNNGFVIPYIDFVMKF